MRGEVWWKTLWWNRLPSAVSDSFLCAQIHELSARLEGFRRPMGLGWSEMPSSRDGGWIVGCLKRCLRWADVCENVYRTLCCQCGAF